MPFLSSSFAVYFSFVYGIASAKTYPILYDTSLTNRHWPFTWQLELAYYSEPETLKFCNPKWKKFVVKSFEKKKSFGTGKFCGM